MSATDGYIAMNPGRNGGRLSGTAHVQGMTTTQANSTTTMPHMRAIAAGVRANVPTLVWGDPGVAKTASLTAFGRASGYHVETVVGSVRESTDFMGLPYENDGVVAYTTLSWAQRCAQADKALLFFDELTTAPPSVQRAMLRILQERVVGEFQLPDSVAIVAAANPASVAVDGWDLPAPIANRLMHVDWRLDTDGWLAGVMTGFTTAPETIETILGRGDVSYRIKVKSQVTTFLRTRPDLLHKMPTDPVTAGKGWPSPRSWTNAMTVLGELNPADEDAALIVLTGCVGDGAAGEYLAWLDAADLYDPDQVMADPSIVDWRGSRPDRLFALVYSIAALIQMRPESVRGWLAAVKVLEACAKGGRPDAAAPAVKLLLAAKPRGASVPDSLRQAFRDLFAGSGRWVAA